MEIIEHVEIINQMKKDKATVEQIESITQSNLNMTYKTLKRKLNQLGYSYVNNRFVKNDKVVDIVPTSNTNIENMQNKIEQLEKIVLEQQKIINIGKMKTEKTDTIQRTIRVSESILNEFIETCQENSIKQVDAVNKALQMYVTECKNILDTKV
jgi:hypothetical protein